MSHLIRNINGKSSSIINLADSDIPYTHPSLGGISRTLQSKSEEIISILDFGAIGDGTSHPLSTINSYNGQTTSGWTLAQWQVIYPFATALTNEIDGCAIQAALNAGNKGQIILFPPTSANVYLTSFALKYYSGQTLIGFGGVGITSGTIIRLVSASTSTIEPNTPSTTTLGFNAKGIYFDAQSNAPCSIKLYNASHSVLNNCAANCNSVNGAGLLIDSANTLQAYFNLIENCRCYATGTGGAGIRLQNGANVNTIIGGKCGSGNYYGLELLSSSAGNTVIGLDIEGATTAAIHIDAPSNSFSSVHIESTPIGFLITSNGGQTNIINPTMASSVTTPISDSSTLGVRLYSTPDTNSTSYLRAGSLNIKSTYLSTGSNWDIDPTLFASNSNSLIRWWLNTLTTGVKQFTIYNGDGTSNYGFLYTPGLLACNAFSIANQIVASSGAWRAYSTAAFKYRNNANSADLTAFTKDANDIFYFGDTSTGSMLKGTFGEGVGISVVSAATITPSSKITPISGTNAISTINIPFSSFTGIIYLLPSAAFTLTTGGNIAKASTAIPNQLMTLAWDGTKWWPSY